MEPGAEGAEVELGKRFWWKMAGGIIGLGILALLVFLVFNGLVWRLGMLGGFIVLFGALSLIAYRSDKKRQREYADD